MSLSDNLHDEIDAIEWLSAEARDIVRNRIAELPSILKDLAQAEQDLLEAGVLTADDLGEPWATIELAMDEVAARVATDMNDLTTKAAQDGVEAGRKRVSGGGV